MNHVSRAAGAEKGLADLTGRLDRKEFIPYAIVPGPGELEDLLHERNVAVNHVNLRRLRRSRNPFRLAMSLLSVSAAVRQLTSFIRRENIDLVHANSDTAQIYCGAAAAGAGVPCVWHSRDLTDAGAAGRYMMKRSSRVIAVSETVKRRLLEYSFGEKDTGKIRLVRNAVDLEAFHARDTGADARKEMAAGPENILVGTVGQIVPWKRHDLFLKTADLLAREVPEARFAVAGDDLFGDHPDYVNSLRKKAAEGVLRGRVSFTGYRRNICAVMKAMDIIVHCAEKEPFGRSVLEAMALGKPVVAVNSCGPAEIIRDRVNGILVKPGDPGAAAGAVKGLIRDPERAAGLGRAAQERVRRDFKIEDLVETIQRTYRELLAV
ncbi:MAG: glycosyltransferase family 4 protein [Kiritimatiellia bacterium]